jgi:hypothetical protein
MWAIASVEWKRLMLTNDSRVARNSDLLLCIIVLSYKGVQGRPEGTLRLRNM